MRTSFCIALSEFSRVVHFILLSLIESTAHSSQRAFFGRTRKILTARFSTREHQTNEKKLCLQANFHTGSTSH